MKFVLTYKEAVANIDFVKMIDKALTDKHFAAGESVSNRLMSLREDLITGAFSAEYLNNTYGDSKNGVTISFEKSEMTIEIDETINTETLKILTDNIDTLIGIGITIYGMVKTFLSVFKKMGKRIEEVSINFNKNANKG